VFYGQINLGGPDGPLYVGSQVLYKAVIDEARGVISITGQGPAEPQSFEDLHRRPELWGEVRMRNEAGVRCDFIWRRHGMQLVGVLEGRTPERRKYGPGTCTYESERGEFYADAEWVLGPEELWLYDINKLGGVQFIGRVDRTHTRLYRSHAYRCTVRDATGSRELAAHDRGFSLEVRDGAGRELELLLLRAPFPAGGGAGLADSLRLMLLPPGGTSPLAQAQAAPLATQIRLSEAGVEAECSRAP
jgi:hypothetical protein